MLVRRNGRVTRLSHRIVSIGRSTQAFALDGRRYATRMQVMGPEHPEIETIDAVNKRVEEDAIDVTSDVLSVAEDRIDDPEDTIPDHGQ